MPTQHTFRRFMLIFYALVIFPLLLAAAYFLATDAGPEDNRIHYVFAGLSVSLIGSNLVFFIFHFLHSSESDPSLIQSTLDAQQQDNKQPAE